MTNETENPANPKKIFFYTENTGLHGFYDKFQLIIFRRFLLPYLP